MKCRTLALLTLLSSLPLACAPAGLDGPEQESIGEQDQALAGVINYEGLTLNDDDVEIFRDLIHDTTKESIASGIKEWNANLLAITEGRKSLFKNGKMTFFYSWCGDWVSYHLWLAGSEHGLALNREAVNGSWTPAMNLTYLRAWAGEPYFWVANPADAVRKDLQKRFKNDPSAKKSWHTWSAQKGGPADGYVPQRGDLVLFKNNSGDHIEHFLEKIPGTTNMRDSAGAQAGGVAAEVVRNMKGTTIIGIIDVTRLAPHL